MPTFRDLLAATKAEIQETDPAGAEAATAAGAVLLDVREPDETAQGVVPGSVQIVRGNLEAQIEARLPDKATPIVVMCAGGVRSAFAAKTLTELGYADVISMDGGFNRWKDEGRDLGRARDAHADQRNRYSRHLLLPELARRVSRSCSSRRCSCSGPAGSAHRPPSTSPRPASAPSASSTWTSSTSRTCSARSCTTSSGWGSARSTRRRRR